MKIYPNLWTNPPTSGIFVRFGNTKGEIWVKKAIFGVVWAWFGNQPPHPPIFGKVFLKKKTFFVTPISERAKLKFQTKRSTDYDLEEQFWWFWKMTRKPRWNCKSGGNDKRNHVATMMTMMKDSGLILIVHNQNNLESVDQNILMGIYPNIGSGSESRAPFHGWVAKLVINSDPPSINFSLLLENKITCRSSNTKAGHTNTKAALVEIQRMKYKQCTFSSQNLQMKDNGLSINLHKGRVIFYF